MIYIILDGDDIGLKIEKSFMENNEFALRKVNEDIKDIVERISNYLVGQGCEMVFGGADGIICKVEEIDIKELSRKLNKKWSPYTFSVGVGSDLRNSFLALRYAKAIGKNVTVIYAGKDAEFEVIDHWF